MFRLYTNDSFKGMRASKVPEIQCANISHVYLELKVQFKMSSVSNVIQMLGVANPLDFPLMDAPSKNALLSAAMELYRLDALDSKGNLTDIG